ncbi:MAG: hypothetical protein ACRC6T_08910 [Sarcina sp.]
MGYGIKKEEAKKVLASKVIWIFITICVCLNIFLIVTSDYFNEEEKAVVKIGEEFGYIIDEKFIDNLDKEEEQNLAQINRILDKKDGETFSSIDEFLEDGKVKKLVMYNDLFSEKDYEFIVYNFYIGTYKNLAIELDKVYKNVDSNKLADNTVELLNLTGKVEELVRKNYSNFGERLDEIRKSGTYKELFFYENEFRYHRNLFHQIFGLILFEIIILVVLIGAFLINYERDNKTALLVASTKRGRKTEKDKLCVVLISSIVVPAIILIPTLITYFITYDYSPFWNTSINSMLISGGGTPLIAWNDLSFRGYLILCIAMVFAFAFIVGIISFVIALLCKSSYKSIFIFFMIFGAIHMLTGSIDENSMIYIYSQFNIFNLITRMRGKWFMGAHPMLLFEHYELMTLTINSLLISGLAIFSYKRYKKEDLI